MKRNDSSMLFFIRSLMNLGTAALGPLVPIEIGLLFILTASRNRTPRNKRTSSKKVAAYAYSAFTAKSRLLFLQRPYAGIRGIPM